MKSLKIAAFLLLTIMLCFPVNVSAVKAYPFPIEVMQPNGEKISIQLHGDEYFHYTTTATDNFVVEKNKAGYYTFAEINDSGKIIPGEKIVSNNILKSDGNNFLKANSDEFIKKIKISAQKQKLEKLKNNTSLRAAKETNVTGEIKGLVILANFKDVKFQTSNNNAAFLNLLNQKDYNQNGATGSARDYFMDNSDGRFIPTFDVFGPVELPQNMAFYGENDESDRDKNPEQMIIDACTIARSQFPSLNFANYDHDKDGVVDNIFVFYAGYGENDSHIADAIWPHQYYVGSRNIKLDGVWLDGYACTSELKSNGSMCGIGVFVHEFGHVIGLPDFYDADYEQNEQGTGIGLWSVMDNGSYLNNYNTPPNHNAMERYMLGWSTPTVLHPTEAGQTYNIEPVSSNQAYIINTPTINEYFLIENRKKGDKWDQWDYRIEGNGGMLVYHVDKTSSSFENDIDYYGETYTVSASDLWWNGIPNIIGAHQCFDLIRANNNSSNYAGMPFIAGHSLADNTTPNLLAWNGLPSGAAITDINRDASGTMSFKLTKTSSQAPIRAPYFEDFATTPNYWTVLDKDNNFESWYFLNSNDLLVFYDKKEDCGFAMLDGSNNSANDWLITPQLYIPAGSSNVNLEFYVVYFSNEKLEIKVSYTNLEESSFETIGTNNLTAPNGVGRNQNISYPLNNYIGKNIYIAFVNKSTNANQMQLTDIAITGNIPPSSITKNNINSPFAFSDDKTVYFKNIPENTQMTIYDVKANIYTSRNICESDNQKISVPGIYIVKLQTDNEVFTYKIIINP